MVRGRLLPALAALVLALFVWRPWTRGGTDATTTARPPRDAAAAPSPSPSPSAASPRGAAEEAPPRRVRRLAPDARRALGARIEASLHRAREAYATAARHGSADVRDPDSVIPLEEVATPLQDALRDAIPLLADCYAPTGTPPQAAAALLTMVSDPDLGTVIDTRELTDAERRPLPPTVDACLRDTIDALALPPLGVPGKLELQYTFRFD